MEVIVVDDGSTDQTCSIAKSFGTKLRYLPQSNGGPAAARNTGIRAARGEWIALLDADDFWLPGFLFECDRFIRSHTECIAVSTGLCFIRAGGAVDIGPKSVPGDFRFQHCSKELDNFFDFWSEHDHIRTGSSVIRREALVSVGLFNEALLIAEDLELWGLLGCCGKWGFIADPLWVCNSEVSGIRKGWLKKNRTRRANCPTVEKWQERIFPRLQRGDWPGFIKVRGRVAQTFAYGKLLGGDVCGARDITQRYGQDFPANPVSRLLKRLALKGITLWMALSLALLLREAGKGWRLALAAEIPAGKPAVGDFKA